MTPRPRNSRNRNLPAGLRQNGKGYFSWRAPKAFRDAYPDKCGEYGLGYDKREAVAQAIEINNDLLGLTQKPRLVDRWNAGDDKTFGAWLDVYEKQLAARKLADNTRKGLRWQAGVARAQFGGDVIDRITTKAVAAFLGGLAETKARTAQAMRSFLNECFRAAQQEGWITSNPVSVTRGVTVEVQRSRLTLEVYRAVHKAAMPWLQDAMDLALVSAQGRDEICGAKFSDFHDGSWFCKRRKTGARIEIPESLYLAARKLSLADVRSNCRSTGVLSPYLIHQTHARGNSPVGSRIHIDTISKRFTETLASLHLDFGGKNPPTFHEIRSLAGRLYAEQGGVDVQALMGHKDPRMTQVYKDARGAEWVKVRIA